MATPRKRYPSDDARLKRPSGVVVGFSIMTPDPDHPGHAQVFSDPEKRGIWTGLLVVAGAGFAGRTQDRVTLTDGQLSWCTGRAQRRHALSSLRAVCELMGYALSDRGHSVVVHVKNLSQNQGWTPQTPRSAPRTPSAPESQSYSQSESNTPPRTEEAESDLPAKNNGKPPKHPEAMRLAELLRDELAANVEHWTPPRSLRAWGSEFDRMLRLDGPQREGIPPPDIERVIRWVVRDPFEAMNVQSASKLRKRFGALSAKARPAGYDPVWDEFKKRMIAEGRMDADGNSISDLEDLDPNNMPDWAEALMGLDDV